jgi:hypothetical protein
MMRLPVHERDKTMGILTMTDELIRLRLRLGSVSVPEHMHGDNLAILLATFYEDADGDIDENGWTELALEATEMTLDAIHAHYADAWNKRTRKESLQVDDKTLTRCAQALVDQHKKYWPGSWPAQHEAKGMASAVIKEFLTTHGDA